MRGTDFTEQADLTYPQSLMNPTSSFNFPIYTPQTHFNHQGILPQLTTNFGNFIHQDSIKENVNKLGFFPAQHQQNDSCPINQKLCPNFNLSIANSLISTQMNQSLNCYSAIDSSSILQYGSGTRTSSTPDQPTPLCLSQRPVNNLQRNFEAYYQVLNIMPYNDDEPTIKYTSPTSLESHLNLSIETNTTYINITKTQTIPVKVTMSVSPMEFYSRPPIDIVCVIEKSQEVGPSFLEALRNSIHKLLSVLNENDRLSLVFYDDFGHRVTHLSRMTEDNKEVVRDALHEVYLSGGVDIADGLGQAMEIIRQRKYINPTTSIFLVGASDDIKSINALEFLFQKYSNEKFYVHSFGIQEHNNNQVLQWIATQKNGAYHQIKEEQDLSNSFFEALTSLSYIQSHEAELYFFTNTKLNPETALSKANNNIVWSIPEKCYKVKIPCLTAGYKEEFYLDVAVPKVNIKALKNGDQLMNVLDVIYRVEAFDNVIMKKENLQVQIYYDINDESTAEQEQGEDQEEIMFEEVRSNYTSICAQEKNSSIASIEKLNKLIVVEELIIEANQFLQQNRIEEAKIVASRLRREAQGLGMEYEVVIKNFLERVYQSYHTESFEDLME